MLPLPVTAILLQPPYRNVAFGAYVGRSTPLSVDLRFQWSKELGTHSISEASHVLCLQSNGRPAPEEVYFRCHYFHSALRRMPASYGKLAMPRTPHSIMANGNAYSFCAEEASGPHGSRCCQDPFSYSPLQHATVSLRLASIEKHLSRQPPPIPNAPRARIRDHVHRVLPLFLTHRRREESRSLKPYLTGDRD